MLASALGPDRLGTWDLRQISNLEIWLRSQGFGRLGTWGLARWQRVGALAARWRAAGFRFWDLGNWAVKSLQNHIKSEIPFRFGSSCVGIWDLGFGFDIGF